MRPQERVNILLALLGGARRVELPVDAVEQVPSRDTDCARP
jgi:hypothetical protein